MTRKKISQKLQWYMPFYNKLQKYFFHFDFNPSHASHADGQADERTNQWMNLYFANIWHHDFTIKYD